MTSQFNYNNGTTNISDPHDLTFQIVEPHFVVQLDWNTTTGDAGDVLGCTLSLQHDAPGYNLIVAAKFAPYFDLITSSITSTAESAIIAPMITTSGWLGIVTMVSLDLGASVTFSFSASLTEFVHAALFSMLLARESLYTRLVEAVGRSSP